MESEAKHVIKQKKNIDVLDILGETLTIYFKNINFIIFTLLTSLPFFFLMVYFETLFQQTLVQTPKIILPLPFHERNQLRFYSVIDIYNGPSFSKDYLPLLIQLGFIYTIPLHFLEFCSKVLTMDLASKLIINSEENPKMSLKHMFQNSIDVSTMKGTFITSLYTLALSNCLLIAFPWTVSNCFIFTRWCYIIFGSICFIAVGKLLMIYLECSAIWNMSIVVSVLEGIYGTGALKGSYYFSSGNHKRGLVMMLVFFVFGGVLSCCQREKKERNRRSERKGNGMEWMESPPHVWGHY
ncbi:transmembrane protein [Medicago truncatula]|uniref:Transmembrane protein n=1 Tax=Medicago truncatula TaxID=3880 RepID=A0A072TTG5_MEDTR|nr:transmembrane protein [Medicago truncatula]